MFAQTRNGASDLEGRACVPAATTATTGWIASLRAFCQTLCSAFFGWESLDPTGESALVEFVLASCSKARTATRLRFGVRPAHCATSTRA
eukprot:11487483-Alexandrium_andersonii.AAC.3